MALRGPLRDIGYIESLDRFQAYFGNLFHEIRKLVMSQIYNYTLLKQESSTSLSRGNRIDPNFKLSRVSIRANRVGIY